METSCNLFTVFSAPPAFAKIMVVGVCLRIPKRTNQLCDFHLQNQLLEVGWNKSEATQWDVEKTLDCCGFSSVNYNRSCPAVSESPGTFFLSLSCSVQQPMTMPLTHHIFCRTSFSSSHAFNTNLRHPVRHAQTPSRSMQERCFAL